MPWKQLAAVLFLWAVFLVSQQRKSRFGHCTLGYLGWVVFQARQHPCLSHVWPGSIAQRGSLATTGGSDCTCMWAQRTGTPSSMPAGGLPVGLHSPGHAIRGGARANRPRARGPRAAQHPEPRRRQHRCGQLVHEQTARAGATAAAMPWPQASEDCVRGRLPLQQVAHGIRPGRNLMPRLLPCRWQEVHRCRAQHCGGGHGRLWRLRRAAWHRR